MKTIKAIVVPVDRREHTELFDISEDRHIQQVVRGDFEAIHAACLANDGSGDLLPLTVWVNEEGLLMGLTPNPRLSFLVGRRIVGRGLITGGVDEDGDPMPVPAHYKQTLDSVNTKFAELS